MLTSFGIFWGAEGAGAHWPGGDAALLAIIPVTLGCALAMVAALRRPAGGTVETGGRAGMRRVRAFGAFCTTSSSATTGASPRASRSPSASPRWPPARD